RPRRGSVARGDAGGRRVVLGVVDGLHDAGAAVVADGVLVAAANEERFTRKKLQGGMPAHSIAAVLKVAGVSPADVDLVAVGGVATPTVATRAFRPAQAMFAPSLGICFDRPWHPVGRTGAVGESGRLAPLHSLGVRASVGAFYSLVTKRLGFVPGRDEGKVLGLAASGSAERVAAAFPFRWEGEDLRYDGQWGLRAKE